MAAIARKSWSKHNKHAQNSDYYQVNNWSMGEKGASAIIQKGCDLYLARNQEEGIRELKKIPLAPDTALSMRDEMGKEALLAEGWNLADAEIVFGKDWLDNYMVD